MTPGIRVRHPVGTTGVDDRTANCASPSHAVLPGGRDATSSTRNQSRSKGTSLPPHYDSEVMEVSPTVTRMWPLRRAAACVLVGGLCGLTWATALIGWMAQLAPGEADPTVPGLRLGLLLPAATLIGALIGWSAYLLGTGAPVPRWLGFSPVLLAPALVHLESVNGPNSVGTGGALAIVIVTALCIGAAATVGRWWVRALFAAAGVLGLLLTAGVGASAAPVDPPRGAWVAIYGVALVVVLGLASAASLAATRGVLRSRGWIALGALVGLAWSCALRSFMSEVAGYQSEVHWVGTFGFILLPGMLIGACVGWAELRRRSGGAPQWRLVLAPFLFAAVLLSNPMNLGELFQSGIGGGTFGIPAIAILGGFAISRRGRAWGRALAGAAFLAGFTTWLLVATDVGGQALALTSPYGMWVSMLFESLLLVFALAASVPQHSSWEALMVEDANGIAVVSVVSSPTDL